MNAKLIAVITLLGAAASAQAAEMARVVSKTEIVRETPTTQQVCDTSTVQVEPQSSGAGATIGAVAGGLLGNTVGRGSGRAAATVVGAIAGAITGDNVERNNSTPTTQTVRNCRNVTQTRDVVVGYRVTYEYAGKQYTTRLARDPGDWVPVNVSATGAAPEDETLSVAPAATTTVVEQPTTVVYSDPPPPVVVYRPAPYPYYWGPAFWGPSIHIGVGYSYGHFHGRH